MDDRERVHYREYGSLLPQPSVCGQQGPATTDTGEVTCEQCTELILANEACAAELEY